MKNGFFFLSVIIFAFPALSHGAASINSSEAITIGGIKQWISIKGTSSTDPVLLFLHGGPGSSAMRYADGFTGELQKHFVVVQWDQRESGQTGKLNVTHPPLTLQLFENDTFEMINYLRTRFTQDKIYLMGHSWGGFLGLAAAAKHPELIAGYIAVNPMIHQVESERQSLEMMKNKAKTENNLQETEELAQVHVPFQNGRQLYYHRKWLAYFMGMKPYSQSFVEAWATTWLAVFNEASEVNFSITAPEIRCPVYFFLGSKDYQTYFKITEDYYLTVKADKKKLFWFTDSGHLVTQTEPKKLQEIIIHQILPKPVK